MIQNRQALIRVWDERTFVSAAYSQSFFFYWKHKIKQLYTQHTGEYAKDGQETVTSLYKGTEEWKLLTTETCFT